MSRATISALIVGAIATGSQALVPTNKCSVPRSGLASSTTEEPPVETLYEIDVEKSSPPRRGRVAMSEAIPFLQRPAVLTGELAGDFGFDPLGLAKNKETLYAYREAEIKHARLAMLAAAGWPASELWDRQIADYFGVASVLDDADRVPSVLNGGIDKIVPEWWGACLGLCGAIGITKSRVSDENYIPGDFGWDPLNAYPKDEEGRQRMKLAEIKHGRLAMMGVTGFAAQEYASKVGVVDETPFFFFPITSTVEDFLSTVAN